jgi:hypothetical protein
MLDRRLVATNAGPHKSFRAGRTLTMMGTGLERDIGRSAVRRFAGLRQRDRFRMGPSASLRPATANQMAFVRNDDAADGWIGRCLSQGALCQAERMLHVAFVVQLGSAAA